MAGAPMHAGRPAPASLAWLSWGLGALFYFSGFYQRVAPAVMTDQLMLDFGIGAAGLGNLSAFYFYSYVAVQIPTGVLTDRWGPRRVLSVGAVTAALGGLLFAGAPTILAANLGMLMIGASVGVAWVALLKLTIHWFPPHRFAFVTGLGLFVGLAGAVSAGVPLRLLVDHFGWRPVMGFSGAVTLMVGVLIWAVVRNDPRERGYRGYAPAAETPAPGSLLGGLNTVLRYRNVWLLAIAPSGVVGPLLAFAGLWGVPFLSTHHGLSPSQSAAFTSAMLLAWALGAPVLGRFSDRMGRRKPIYLSGALAACLGWVVVLFPPRLPLWAVAGLFVLIGFASGAMIVGFAFTKESLPAGYGGTAGGVVNMGVMTGPMVLQPVMGWILDRQWRGGTANGVRIYDLDAYHSAFLCMIAFTVMAVFLLLLTQETRGRRSMVP